MQGEDQATDRGASETGHATAGKEEETAVSRLWRFKVEGRGAGVEVRAPTSGEAWAVLRSVPELAHAVVIEGPTPLEEGLVEERPVHLREILADESSPPQ
jgi:hypothetical protein